MIFLWSFWCISVVSIFVTSLILTIFCLFEHLQTINLVEKSVNLILAYNLQATPDTSMAKQTRYRMDLSNIVTTSIDVQELSSNQVSDPEFAETTTNPSFLFKCLPLFTCDSKIHCDVSTGKPRPFVPQSHRRKIFDHFHGMSHPSIRSTTKMIADRFIWKNIRQDVRQWAKHCLTCQTSKIHKHTRSPLSAFPLPDGWFRHIHVDIVGPLSPSSSSTHILTCIDWLTRRPIAVPLSDNLSETVARKLKDFRISMYENKNSVSIDFTVSPSLVNTNCYRTQHPSKASGSTSLNNPDTYLTAPSAGPLISQHKPTRSGRTIRLLQRLILLNTTSNRASETTLQWRGNGVAAMPQEPFRKLYTPLSKAHMR